MNRVLIVLLAFLVSSQLHGQDDVNVPSSSLHGICRTIDDTIKLRWAPSDWSLLKGMMQGGVTLRKIKYEAGDTVVADTLITVPTSLELQRMRPQHEYAEAVEAALYDYSSALSSGDPISSFRQSEIDNSRHGMLLFLADLDFELACSLGLGWQDQRLGRNVLTEYRIIVNNSEVWTSIYDDYLCSSDPLPIQELYAFPEESSIVLTWNLSNNPSGYIAFNIERSVDSASWMIVNDHPIANTSESDVGGRELITYQDSVVNFQEYHYRVRGITSFGETGPVGHSVSASARPRLNINQPYIQRIRAIADSILMVSWQIGGLDSGSIVRINLLHSEEPGGAFQIQDSIPAGRRNYAHRTRSLQNYYIVQAVDSYGRVYTGPPSYGHLPDRVPPKAPGNVMAESDSLGNIMIQWSPNDEEDLLGYRVFFTRYSNDSIVQLTRAAQSDTFYQHKLELNMLRREGYYMIRAEDKAGNRSPDSKLVKVVVPDTIAPARPSIVSGTSSTRGVHLYLSLSTSPDIQHQILYRKEDHEWHKTQFDPNQSGASFRQEYFDSLLVEGEPTSYRLVAVDSSGNKAFSNIFEAGRIDNKLRTAPEAATVSWDKRAQELVFTWTVAASEKLNFVRILRRVDGSDHFRAYKVLRTESLPSSIQETGKVTLRYALQFDSEPVQYEYKMRIEFEDGAVSPLVEFEVK